MDVDTILDQEYNMVGGAEVIKFHQLIFFFLIWRYSLIS